MSACVSPVSLLDNGSVYTFPRQRIHETNNCWTRRFLCGPCRMKWDSVGLSVYCHIVARQWLGKRWRHHFLCGPCRIKGKQAIRSFQNLFQDKGNRLINPYHVEYTSYEPWPTVVVIFIPGNSALLIWIEWLAQINIALAYNNVGYSTNENRLIYCSAVFYSV
jgi:hypothetical protein